MLSTQEQETADQLLGLRHTLPDIEVTQTAEASVATETTETTEATTETETETEANDLKEFLEYKNLSPFRTAKALFPIPVECPSDWFVKEIAKKNAQANKKPANNKQAKNKPHDGHDNLQPMVPQYVLQTSWRGAAEEICNQFASHYSIHCSFSRSDWVTSTFQRTKDGVLMNKKIYGQQWGENYKVPFICSACKAAGKYALLAVGVTTGTDKILDKGFTNTGFIAASHGIEVSQVYFHDSHCSGPSSTPSSLWYQTSKYCVVPFDFNVIMGHTYSKAVQKLQGFPVEPPYFDPVMSEADRVTWMENFGGVVPWKDKSTKVEKHTAYPQPGSLINFGDDSYDHDDRMYCYLPSDEWQISGEDHKDSTVRWIFHLTAHFSMSREMAPYVLNYKSIQEQMDDKTSNITNWVHMPNPDCHLRPTEVSLLFGGHEQRVCGDDPTHQMRHRDGDTEQNPYGKTEALNELFFPFSFIIPLEDKRDLYIGTPATTISVPKNFYVIFRGDLPHGGVTFRQLEWHPCIHGHMDSDHHNRDSGLFNYSSEHDGYLPIQHMGLMHNTANMCAHFVDLEAQYKNLLKLACNMTPWLTASMQLEVGSSEKMWATKVNSLLNNIGLNRYNFCKKKARTDKAKK